MYEKELKESKKAVLKAGKIVMKYFEEEKISKTKKKDKTYVTKADIESEKIILKILKEKFPKYSYSSEESELENNNSEYLWLIDPIDGTHNFMNKIPYFGISIGLLHKKEFVLSVIYLPFTKELFWAKKNNGAYLNNKQIFVSKNKLKESIGSLPSATMYNGSKNIIKLIKQFIDKTLELRLIGSSNVRIAYTACRRFDFYITNKTDSLDEGHGKLMIEEAKGKFTQINGKKFCLNSKDFIASNKENYNEILKILNK